MELRAEHGRALVVGAPELFEPPAALASALNEWAEVAAAVCANGALDRATAELVSARGRRLAVRLAAAAGVAVGYHDPVSGTLERVSSSVASASSPPAASSPGASVPPAASPADASSTAGTPPDASPSGVPAADAVTAAPPPAGADPLPDAGGTARRPGAPPWLGQHAGREAGDADLPAPASEGAGDDRPLPGTEPPAGAAEPTPWATGLTVSAFVAVVVLAAVGTLVQGLAEVGWWLGGIGLAVVTAGLMPSVWLARHTPLWRWLSYGVAAGLALSWAAGILATLGP